MKELIALVVLLFLAYFVINRVEKFTVTDAKRKSCSQTSINDGYRSYIFGENMTNYKQN